MTSATLGTSGASRDSGAFRYGVFALLALAMAVTRFNHFGLLPDASWAIFFVGGFYLRREWRWAFPLLMVEAVLVDYFVISSQGISFWEHYCVSAAYWFLVPSYFAMWYGGAWLATHYAGLSARSLALAAAAFVVALSVCYLISNGSFYWLSASVPQPRSFPAWFKNLGDWYLPYLTSQGIYFGIAVALHAIAVQFTHTPAGLRARV